MVKKTSRPKRSFIPKVLKPVKMLTFREAEAKWVGFTEPEWPELEIQNAWTKNEFDLKILAALNWYTFTNEDKKAHELALAALATSGQCPELISAIKASKFQISHTAAWLIRMLHCGMKLRISEGKVIVRALRWCIDNPKIVVPAITIFGTPKPNIQDHINAKLKSIQGQLDAAFDDFLEKGQKFPSQILSETPGNRTNDLIVYCDRYLSELKAAQSNDESELSEAFAYLSKKQLKNAITWWEDVIINIARYGQSKKNNRKPRKKKATSPEKIVSKLKFTKSHAELNLKSIDPVQILRSTQLWIYNCKTRKIGFYVALPNSSFDVKGTKILNIDPLKSIQKVLRRPQDHLAKFTSLGKPASFKWFEEINATPTKLGESLNKDSILLKAIK